MPSSGPALLQLGEHHCQQPLDGRGFDHAERHRPGGKDGHGLFARFLQGVKHAGHFMVRSGQSLANRVARDQQLLLEMGQRRRLPDERVRFLQAGR